jgi:mannose-6-phosphate isomerase-like protein (cupin superfamily)
MTEHINPNTPSYPGPRNKENSVSGMHIVRASEKEFQKEGLRSNSEYCDLGLSKCTNGLVSIKHNRGCTEFTEPTGWHWHDMQAHFVYVLKGSITFLIEGVEEPITLMAGDSLSQPCGVPHNVVARSNDYEVLELNIPAEYGTFEVPAQK